MAAIDVTPPQLNQARVQGAKNATDLATVTAAIASAVKTYLDGTEGTHPTYNVEITVKQMGT